jgi:integrase
MKYTEAVYKRKRQGMVIYDGVLTYYDEDGTRKFKHCERKTRGDALEALRKARQKLESGGSKAVESDRMTFSDLIEYCGKEVYVKAEYNEAGEKQSGVRGLSVYRAHLKHLKEFFKGTLLRDITVAHLKRYRSYRLSCKRVAIVEKDGQKVKVEKTISPGTVSRELNTLRAMLFEAKRNRWIQENPFREARRNEVIRSSDKKSRNLVLSYEQETRLIEACRCEDRRHLWAMAITAADTGGRFGELIALEKSQLDFGARFIRGFTNYKGKGGDRQSRDIAMTDRVYEALLDLAKRPPTKAFRKLKNGEKPSENLVFGISSNVRRAWRGALEDAGLAHLGLHFHDLRHCAATKVKAYIPLVDIAKALGHADPKLTAQVYMSHNEEDLRRFAAAVQQAGVEAQARLFAKNGNATRFDQESELIS